MQKTKNLKKCKVLMLVCAIMLVFGAVTVVSGGVDANVGILSISVTYEAGDGPKNVELKKTDDTWNTEADRVLAEAPTTTDKGFEFMGWTDSVTKENDELKLFQPGDKYEVKTGNSDPITFKAVWGVEVTYDKNLDDTAENITVPGKLVKPYKTDLAIDEKLTATNYDFLGWSTEAKKDDATPEYKYGDVIKAADVTGPITLYAIWDAKFFTVVYHANTGSDTNDSAVTVPVDTTKYMGETLEATIMGDGKLATDNPNAATMKDATPARTGYTFAGWAETATDKTVKYKPGDKVTLTKDLELYAVWTSGTATTAGTTNNTATTSKTPQTGTEDSMLLYVIMAVLSLAGIAYLCYDQKKAKATK